ncbi:MAG: 23S rRNA (uracil(1939)-C(5))-methyltransferase RlmD [Atopostipes sp.]|nr:23S rRNA (uracil(1939)-C(5))-methyltransferase RlmD [Atopostipes sp.]
MKKKPIKENDIIEIKINDLSYRGLGVGHVEDFPIFIENALPNEKVKVRIDHVGRRKAHGLAVEIIEESPDRVEIISDLHRQNGTMPLQHLAYQEQLKFKQNQVKDALSRIANIQDFPVKETIGMEDPYGYRNKAQIPVREIDGELTTGFYRKGSHDLIPIEDFVIQAPEIDEAILIVRDILRNYKVKAYNEEEHSGDIRHIIVRRGHKTEEIMIVLVTNNLILPYAQKIVADIQAEIPELVSIVQNINTEETNVILGDKSMILYQQDYYEDELLGHRFKISAESFYQVNSVQTEKLYQTAVDFADLTGEEYVLDAYCGIGTMTLALAEEAKEVYGVEIVPEAIDDARLNAKDNEMENVRFAVGDAGKWLVKKARAGFEVDRLVVDPPRKGLSKDFVESVIKIQPERMVYVSCNPNTMARDIELLLEGGYDLKKVQPVDMFPQTYHIESVALLEKKK